jgi:DNA repair exonuclease SbcCD ATPase subunit
MNVITTRHRLDTLLTEYRLAKRAVVTEKAALREGREQVAALTEAQTLVQEAAQAVQTTAHNRIASIVSRCLAELFEEPYTFRIAFTKERGKTSARLELERDGLVLTDPLAECGGGICDVASFALRVSCLLLSTPHRRRVLFLDEPLKHLSAEYRPIIRKVIEKLSKELSVQMIIVSHAHAFRMGKVIELEGD